jgi:hypothetical protein
MQTYKNLNWKIHKDGVGGWRVQDSGGSTIYESQGKGNKGKAMTEALRIMQDGGGVIFSGNRWMLNSKSRA